MLASQFIFDNLIILPLFNNAFILKLAVNFWFPVTVDGPVYIWTVKYFAIFIKPLFTVMASVILLFFYSQSSQQKKKTLGSIKENSAINITIFMINILYFSFRLRNKPQKQIYHIKTFTTIAIVWCRLLPVFDNDISHEWRHVWLSLKHPHF